MSGDAGGAGGSDSNVSFDNTSLVSALLSGGLGILQTLIQGWFGLGGMSKQHDYNLSDWNLQNEYNDPSKQMERMINAGISPAAAAKGISGNGASSTGISPTAQGDFHVSDFTGLQQLLANQPNYMLNKRTAQVQNALADAQRRYYDTLNNEKISLLPHEIKKISLENLNLAQAGELSDAQKDLYLAQTARLKLLTPLEAEKFLSDIQGALALKDKLEAEKGKINAEKYGIEKDNVIKAFKAAYVDAYKADPNGDVVKEFVQMCLSGDDSGNDAANGILDAFVGTIKQIINSGHRKVESFFDNLF